MIDWTVNLGSIINILALLAGAVGFAYTIKTTVGYLVIRLDKLEIEIRKLTDVLIKLGRQDERLNAMDRRIDEMRRGKGFIVEDFRSASES